MFKRTPWRPIAAGLILLATAAVFIRYFATHPEVRTQIKSIPPGTLLLLLGLYVIFTGSLALINSAALRLCRARVSAGESLLLTMYSSVINFFGPLQSGPAFRGIYLKQKHGIKLKDYTLASFVYYFFYAFSSSLLLLSGVLKWWLIPLSVAGLLIAAAGHKRKPGLGASLNLSAWPYMAIASLIQVGLMVIIYYVELRSVAPGVHLSQVLVYTGAGNLALFVSLTPGAIGFRESFLIFSEKLHHISSGTIVAATTIDRAVYVVLLLLSAVVIFATHAKRKLVVANGDS